MFYKPGKENNVLDEVLYGLTKPDKELPSKFFYNEKGSKLFDEITRLPEYYPTRTEMQIMEENIEEIGGLLGEGTLLVELGSGSSKKIRLLLEHIPGLAAYVPVDISEEHLLKAVDKLSQDYPALDIIPLVADYTKDFKLPEIQKPFDHIASFYPGSTIGNFKPREAKNFLARIARLIGKNGGIIIGVDLKKDKDMLEAAYNDNAGITAKFNLNILDHINYMTGANFDTNKFHHMAFYNETEGRIEMHLISNENQIVKLNGTLISFKMNDDITTEFSYKFSLNEFRDLVSDYFEVRKVWTDHNKLFSIQYLRVK